MISTHEIGITDCTTLIGTAGTLTSASPARIGRIDAPTQPSSAKKAMTSTCARMLSARRTGGDALSTSSGQLMWARRTDASAEP